MPAGRPAKVAVEPPPDGDRTFAHRRGGYVSAVLLIGLIGGIAMASIEAGRRTQSSYPTFLARTNPSDLSVSVFAPNSAVAVATLTSRLGDCRMS